MSISVQCECGKKYAVDERYAGKQLRCKACNRGVTVPSLDADGIDEGEYDLTEPAPMASPAAGQARRSPAAGARLAPVQSDGVSRASNPGRLYVDVLHFFRCHLGPLGVIAGAFVLWAIATPFIPMMHGLWWIPLLIFPVIIWTQVSEIKQKMSSGDICPAVVTGQFPYRVAVYTDLTAGGGSHPAVFVMDAANLKYAAGGPPAVGDRLAAVSLYQGPPRGGAWQGFTPTLVDAVTRNAADITRVTGSINDDEWAALDRAVAELGDVEPGLYRLTV
jgi:hypothetical protein